MGRIDCACKLVTLKRLGENLFFILFYNVLTGCAPNLWAISNEYLDFAHPILGTYFMYCAPNVRLLPPPLPYNIYSYLIMLYLVPIR